MQIFFEDTLHEIIKFKSSRIQSQLILIETDVYTRIIIINIKLEFNLISIIVCVVFCLLDAYKIILKFTFHLRIFYDKVI